MDEQAATTAAYFIYHMQNHEAIRRTFPCYHDHEAFDRISGVEEDISISASLNCIYEVNNVILLIAFITTHDFFYILPCCIYLIWWFCSPQRLLEAFAH